MDFLFKNIDGTGCNYVTYLSNVHTSDLSISDKYTKDGVVYHIETSYKGKGCAFKSEVTYEKDVMIDTGTYDISGNMIQIEDIELVSVASSGADTQEESVTVHDNLKSDLIEGIL